MFNLSEKIGSYIGIGIKALPLISVVLIICGYFSESSFYEHYDIDIIHYMETSEILLSFLPFFKAIIFPVLLFSFIGFTFDFSETKEKQKWKRILKIIGSFFGIAILIALMFSLKVVYFMKFGKAFANTIFFLCMFSLIFGNVLKSLRLKIKVNLFYVILLVMLFVTIFISSFNFSRYETVKEGLVEVSFSYNNESVSTNCNNRFIGRTQKYLFLRNVEKSITSAYELDEVKNFKVKKNTRDFFWGML